MTRYLNNTAKPKCITYLNFPFNELARLANIDDLSSGDPYAQFELARRYSRINLDPEQDNPQKSAQAYLLEAAASKQHPFACWTVGSRCVKRVLENNTDGGSYTALTQEGAYHLLVASRGGVSTARQNLSRFIRALKKDRHELYMAAREIMRNSSPTRHALDMQKVFGVQESQPA